MVRNGTEVSSSNVRNYVHFSCRVVNIPIPHARFAIPLTTAIAVALCLQFLVYFIQFQESSSAGSAN